MDSFKKGLKWFFASFIWLGVILLILDFVTKISVVLNKDYILSSGGVVLIPNFLRINYLINNNMVFGISLGSDLTNRIAFCAFALLIIIGLIIFTVIKWGKLNKFYRATIMMILAGAIGNVIDRIFYSPEFLANPVNGVVDWIDFYGIWKFNFNIADSCVVVAAIMLIVYMIVNEIIDYRKNNKYKPKEDNEKVLSKTEQEKNAYLEDKDE